MNLNKLTLLLTSIASLNALAIMEPYFMRAGEIADITALESIKKTIQDEDRASGFIDAVTWDRSEGDFDGPTRHVLYSVNSGKCTLGVRVTYEIPPPPYAGPGEQTIKAANNMTCRRR